MLGEIAKLIDAGKLKPLVETVLPLSEVQKAHELNEGGACTRQDRVAGRLISGHVMRQAAEFVAVLALWVVVGHSHVFPFTRTIESLISPIVNSCQSAETRPQNVCESPVGARAELRDVFVVALQLARTHRNDKFVSPASCLQRA